ncbi:uncharacterized protein SCHCODRAFT_02728933 [Schizophyllum commune H4-8]|uniref:uncharacterized protein n=1 Tax=Schizophyllum commune (strain H4-8 / FGSC 9210) TaxID=578458 RepID=UPI00215F499F|nr:uncharacterized protein SCHCODRAFT_02728933 [Schizophyllum commune H4-8]KAI5895824.1 hypothetical protein SCHCODRAFT_02728933 [Schizophyllum commune H4-8]
MVPRPHGHCRQRASGRARQTRSRRALDEGSLKEERSAPSVGSDSDCSMTTRAGPTDRKVRRRKPHTTLTAAARTYSGPLRGLGAVRMSSTVSTLTAPVGKQLRHDVTFYKTAPCNKGSDIPRDLSEDTGHAHEDETIAREIARVAVGRGARPGGGGYKNGG